MPWAKLYVESAASSDPVIWAYVVLQRFQVNDGTRSQWHHAAYALYHNGQGIFARSLGDSGRTIFCMDTQGEEDILELRGCPATGVLAFPFTVADLHANLRGTGVVRRACIFPVGSIRWNLEDVRP
jgi:hypothetical protein